MENETNEETQRDQVEQLSSYLSTDGSILTMHINDDISDESLNPIINAISLTNMQTLMDVNEVEGDDSEVDEENEPLFARVKCINLFINSNGGDLNACCQLLTAMDASRVPVRTIAWGSCASAALIILMAGHERLVSKHTLFMSHHASFGTAAGMQHTLDKSVFSMSKNINQLMNEFYLTYTGKDKGYIKRHLIKTSKDDVYFMAREAIKHGIADDYFTNFDQLTVVPYFGEVD